VVDLGWFGFIGRPLLWLLQKFPRRRRQLGIAIILLTFLVKALTLYWTTRSMRSMKAMAALAPQMKATAGQVRGRQAAPAGRDDGALQATRASTRLRAVCRSCSRCRSGWRCNRMLSSAGELYQQPFIPGLDQRPHGDRPYYVPARGPGGDDVRAGAAPAGGGRFDAAEVHAVRQCR